MDANAIPVDDPGLEGEPGKLDGGPGQPRAAELGHRVRVAGVADDAGAVLRALEEQKPELVFNLTEQFADNRQYDTNVAGLLEMMRIPSRGLGPPDWCCAATRGYAKSC